MKVQILGKFYSFFETRKNPKPEGTRGSNTRTRPEPERVTPEPDPNPTFDTRLHHYMKTRYLRFPYEAHQDEAMSMGLTILFDHFHITLSVLTLKSVALH